MKKNVALALIVISIVLFARVITDTIVNHPDPIKKLHIDKFCGAITNLDGSTDPIQVTVNGQDEMSFDFRSNPGKLSLRRCEDGK